MLFGILKGSSFPDVSLNAWEMWSQKKPSQLDFSFVVLAGRAEGHRD